MNTDESFLTVNCPKTPRSDDVKRSRSQFIINVKKISLKNNEHIINNYAMVDGNVFKIITATTLSYYVNRNSVDHFCVPPFDLFDLFDIFVTF